MSCASAVRSVPPCSEKVLSSIFFARRTAIPRIAATTSARSESQLRPRITEPSIWHSIIPKYFRKDNNRWSPASPSQSANPNYRSRVDFNPITVYIVLFLLVGSNAINQIRLKTDFQNHKRTTDAKIDLLKEVIQRVNKGENVNVAEILGTGDEEKEKEWEQGEAIVLLNSQAQAQSNDSHT